MTTETAAVVVGYRPYYEPMFIVTDAQVEMLQSGELKMGDRKKIIRIELLNAYAGDEWALADFINFFRDVPDEFKGAVRIELTGGYEETTNLIAWYDRIETDEECNARIEQEQLRAKIDKEQREREERRQYESLKRKFEA